MSKLPAVEVGAISDRGMRRQENEDSLGMPPANLAPDVLARKGHLYLVADGMGGHKAGKTASDLAARVTLRHYYTNPVDDVAAALGGALQAANAEVHRLAQEPEYEHMGTTIVAAVVRGASATVAHIGDSRAYLIGRRGIHALTADHSWVAEQVRNRALTPEQAGRHEQRHILTRSMGRDPDVDFELAQVHCEPGDRLVLCSDGLWEMVDDQEIGTAVSRQAPQDAARTLVELAKQRGGPDNISVIIIETPTGASRAVSPSLAAARQLLNRIIESAGPLVSRQRWLLAAGTAALLLVAGICLISALLQKRAPDPVAPDVEIAPVRYEVREGDTREGIADYFGVALADIPSPLQPGQVLTLQPVKYAILFSGVVRHADQGPGAVNLTVETVARTLEVEAPLGAEGLVVTGSAAPQERDTVTVLGYETEEGTIHAAAIDVRHEGTWDRWYHKKADSQTWVYSAFHEYLLLDRDLGHYSENVLVLSRWYPEKRATQLDWHQDDLFLLDNGNYVSYLPIDQRPSLAGIVASSPTSAPQETPTAVPQSDMPASSSYPGIITSNECLYLRTKPTTRSSSLDCYPSGTPVKVLCRSERDPLWYRVEMRAPRLVGFLFSEWIELENALPEEIPSCSDQ